MERDYNHANEDDDETTQVPYLVLFVCVRASKKKASLAEGTETENRTEMMLWY